MTLVFGKTGQVATELQVDLTDPDACFAAIMEARPLGAYGRTKLLGEQGVGERLGVKA